MFEEKLTYYKYRELKKRRQHKEKTIPKYDDKNLNCRAKI